jgi:hypothetical protein
MPARSRMNVYVAITSKISGASATVPSAWIPQRNHPSQRRDCNCNQKRSMTFTLTALPSLPRTSAYLRARLQNDWRKPRFIATVPGRGYRFLPTYAGGTDAVSAS